MELNIKFTARPTPEGLTRILVLVITIITVLGIKKASYWPGTVVPAVLSAGLAAAQASRVLLPGPGPVSLARPDVADPAAPSV